jgi:predicted RNA binding protein YcfA (HicA-like mRNA interferase family)
MRIQCASPIDVLRFSAYKVCIETHGGAVRAREVIKLLERDGWRLVKEGPGAHKQFKHPTKPGKVTVSDHGAADIPPGTLRNIERQSGLRLRPG